MTIYALPHTFTAPSLVKIPHQRGAFGIVDEPPLTHHYQSKCIDIRFYFWWCAFCKFGKRIMIYIHFDNIIKNIFITLNILYALPLSPLPNTPSPLATTDNLVSIVLAFSESHNMIAFQVSFFYFLVLYI